MKKAIIALSLVALASGCTGMRTAKGTFATHAEAFRIVGYPIPFDDEKAAYDLVPKGAKIESVSVTPADWTSFVGFIGNLFWFHETSIAGLTN